MDSILYLAADFFRGARALLVVPLGMVTDIACSTGVGWPIFSALNAEAAEPVKYGAALLTIALGLALVHAMTTLAVRVSGGGPVIGEARPRVAP